MKKFSAERRIKKRSRFLEIQAKGKKIASKNFVFLYLPTQPELPSRIGITVSKKVSKKAVTRNKLRRRIKEIFRLNGKELSYDLVIIAYQESINLSFEEIKAEILIGLSKIKF